MDLGLRGKKVIMNGGAHGLGLQSLKLFAAEGAQASEIIHPTGEEGAVYKVGDLIGTIEK